MAYLCRSVPKRRSYKTLQAKLTSTLTGGKRPSQRNCSDLRSAWLLELGLRTLGQVRGSKRGQARCGLTRLVKLKQGKQGQGGLQRAISHFFLFFLQIHPNSYQIRNTSLALPSPGAPTAQELVTTSTIIISITTAIITTTTISAGQ